ncbi:bifunctional D-glycero-beta-D-manno-heptose-7-phosphate kinase/D-glycero-beta-D-manno-heptose 1-phosphate adenylyltransferase HldE [uncultured Thiodictyon sp.]|uniref:bifunctional D-glycero-beta-D-manno-heptose-7-phosphate kinase/D-glycero-beta-D-manno-heptose 1-phosphate adenylyltransferase HldE n=1 Tax=uncultured Thiodictyon sp. TaxID=1846217 RepID=UPI0025DF636F|nr:bifunctional D-glycero-beta-D-manno-heptose-7-phosphate kinase/D-glycero-beta-D-manno-heptose 1-phosphate adenylyltransferase HldE [uncultured Thiodictyon sp.]
MEIEPDRLARPRVLVVGDVMLDRYWSGTATRISPEAPVPVVHVQKREERAGGAANVALNILALGAHCDLLGVIGDDESGETIGALLRNRGVSCHFQVAAGTTTCTKFRILSQHQQLLRVDMEEGLDHADHGDLQSAFLRLINASELVILSDYGKGTLADPQGFIRAARALSRPVLIDPKGRDFGKYRGATLITPNRAEFEAVVGHCATEAELLAKGEALLRDIQLEALLITRGEQGMTLLSRTEPPHHLQSQAREVYDVTGAGDTVIAVLAAALGAGYRLIEAAHLANTAAGIVVSKLGAATTTATELRQALRGQARPTQGILGEPELIAAVRQARDRGERIVMTNGCFDMLHSGHVTYLEQARTLGDRLIVAVNSDTSVRQLKGPTRPVQALATRMAVLAALRAVDWVISFNEPTPERLYCLVLPDVLAKGGDYSPDQIAGADCVREHGGEVRVLNYVEGESTTAVIRRIRQD